MKIKQSEQNNINISKTKNIVKKNKFHNIRWQNIFPDRPEEAAIFGSKSLSVS